ncbi:MAG: response regulator transcription factor [Ferrimicrobium sp.]
MGALTILIVEDDPSIADLLEAYLKREDATVLLASTGEEALAIAHNNTLDAVVLDLNLPGLLDGLDVCKGIRANSTVPIVILSARDHELDRVLGLELGADDYVTKPFSPRELVARIHAILRRTSRLTPSAQVLTYNTISWNRSKHLVTIEESEVALTNREFDLLGFLILNLGIALSRRQLLDGVWGPEWYGDDRTVDVHVRQLRKKLGDALPIATVWGVGYRLD